MKSYVTTKTGDAGRTCALDGSIVPKHHPMMEAVGALDTMRTHIALLRTHLEEHQPEAQRDIEFLLFLLHTCFLIGSAISDPSNQKPQWHPVRLGQRHLDRLEAEQEYLESRLQLPHAFIVCAANVAAAYADMAASFTRAFERRLVAFQEAVPEFNDPVYGAYVNRLSDYFFILARHLEAGKHLPVDYTKAE